MKHYYVYYRHLNMCMINLTTQLKYSTTLKDITIKRMSKKKKYIINKKDSKNLDNVIL